MKLTQLLKIFSAVPKRLSISPRKNRHTTPILNCRSNHRHNNIAKFSAKLTAWHRMEVRFSLRKSLHIKKKKTDYRTEQKEMNTKGQEESQEQEDIVMCDCKTQTLKTSQVY